MISWQGILTPLAGSISPEIGKLTKLSYIDLRYNKLRGSIPSEIGQCTDLRTLLLYGNQFRGTIPSEIVALPKMEICSLQLRNSPTNCFDCPLPASINCGTVLSCSAECDSTTVQTTTTTTSTLPATTSTSSFAASRPASGPTTRTTPTKQSEIDPVSTTGSDAEASVSLLPSTTLAGSQPTSAQIESRVFIHLYQSSSSGSDYLNTVILLSCVLVLALPLSCFLAYAWFKRRYDNRDSRELSLPPGSQAGGSLPAYGEYGRVFVPHDVEVGDYAEHGAMLRDSAVAAQAKFVDRIYEAPDTALDATRRQVRVSVNYDPVPVKPLDNYDHLYDALPMRKRE